MSDTGSGPIFQPDIDSPWPAVPGGKARFAPELRRDRAHFNRIRRGLLREFGDGSFSRTKTIEALAHDMLQADRIRTSVEAFHRPVSWNETGLSADTQMWLKENRRTRALVRRARRRLEHGRVPLCLAASTKQLCELLKESAKNALREYPQRRRLTDESYLVRIIRGSSPPETGDSETVRGLLRTMERRLDEILKARRDAWSAWQKQERRKISEEDFKTAQILTQMLDRVERRIERKLKQLSRG